jgi:hypothetical protein
LVVRLCGGHRARAWQPKVAARGKTAEFGSQPAIPVGSYLVAIRWHPPTYVGGYPILGAAVDELMIRRVHPVMRGGFG